ncbi:hypothetical protein [Breoghania sp.]|nr:hypothetical protein [Breoghania sp.]MDJ0932725.1 hypothetical protein [Breoghania sp.]
MRLSVTVDPASSVTVRARADVPVVVGVPESVAPEKVWPSGSVPISVKL